MFGVVFPDRSYPMDASHFTQIDPLHFVLDLGPSYFDMRTLCLFLLSPSSLPPNKSLALYAQPPNHPFIFCGAVHSARPSALLSLPWPDPSECAPDCILDPSVGAKIGLSIEDLDKLPPVVDAGAERRAEKVAMKVGENLFNFMQSFCGVDGSRLVVPMDILDRWFKKFQERAKKDPEYLKGFYL